MAVAPSTVVKHVSATGSVNVPAADSNPLAPAAVEDATAVGVVDMADLLSLLGFLGLSVGFTVVGLCLALSHGDPMGAVPAMAAMRAVAVPLEHDQLGAVMVVTVAFARANVGSVRISPGPCTDDPMRSVPQMAAARPMPVARKDDKSRAVVEVVVAVVGTHVGPTDVGPVDGPMVVVADGKTASGAAEADQRHRNE